MPDAVAQDAARASFRRGVRAGIPFSLAGGLLSMSFGVLAHDVGMSLAAATVMSAIVFAGSAQFASVSIIAAGGSLGAAVGAAALMNSRFLAMGIALAPSLTGGPLRRAAEGQAIVDASWAMAARGDGTFDRWFMLGATAPQYVTWVSGTALGALAGGALANPGALGIDAIFPTFFLALLINEIRSGDDDKDKLLMAFAGGGLALALVPLTAPGLPVLAASAVALYGLRRRGSRRAGEPS